MTKKELYKMLKNGTEFYVPSSCSDSYDSMYVFIGTCDEWGSPSYGKDYIYWKHGGCSANRVNFREFSWLLSTIFEMNANEFYKVFKTR